MGRVVTKLPPSLDQGWNFPPLTPRITPLYLPQHFALQLVPLGGRPQHLRSQEDS